MGRGWAPMVTRNVPIHIILLSDPASTSKAEELWAIKAVATSPSEEYESLRKSSTHTFSWCTYHARPQIQTSRDTFSSQSGSFGSFIIWHQRLIAHKLSSSLWSLTCSPSQALLHPTKLLIRDYYLIDLKQPCPVKHALYTPSVVRIMRISLQTDVFRSNWRETARNLPNCVKDSNGD